VSKLDRFLPLPGVRRAPCGPLGHWPARDRRLLNHLEWIRSVPLAAFGVGTAAVAGWALAGGALPSRRDHPWPAGTSASGELGWRSTRAHREFTVGRGRTRRREVAWENAAGDLARPWPARAEPAARSRARRRAAASRRRCRGERARRLMAAQARGRAVATRVSRCIAGRRALSG